MAGAQFEYDEQGHTSYYVVISFYLFLLLPFTWFLWPRKAKKDTQKSVRRCHCEGCDAKELRKKNKEPYAASKRRLRYLVLLLAWAGFMAIVYKVSTIDIKQEEYDPYAILGLDTGASTKQVKGAYRKLALVHHPDRGGDEVTFNKIAKAYAALTNEESKANWEKYGNPDGPGATTFGIALPKWIVSKEYGIWVLAAYGLVFMVVLPTAVVSYTPLTHLINKYVISHCSKITNGYWWYNSIKYSADQVLMDTTHLYFSLLHKTPNMISRRAIAVLSGAFEFWKVYNKDVIERPSDDREVPQLLKDLPKDNVKERPLCFPYSIKTRAILLSHLNRIPLPIHTLDVDRAFILHKVPLLIQEMVQIFSQLVVFASAGRINRTPTIDTLENIVRLLPMFVQASWDTRSALLQLPHFHEDMLRHCITKKRRIRTCQDLACMPSSDRRLLLRNLSDAQYTDVVTTLRMMPRVEATYVLEVSGEDDKHTITAGSLVTVRVTLTRTPLLTASDESATAATPSQSQYDKTFKLDTEDEEDEADDDKSTATGQGQDDDDQSALNTAPKRKPWQKQEKKKKTGKKAPPKKKPPPKKVDPKALAVEETNKSEDSPSKSSRRDRDRDLSDREDDESNSAGSDSEDDLRDAVADANEVETDDEETLAFDDELMKKDTLLETKSKVTHVVHSPFFPEEKYEWWWVYVCDRKRKLLMTPPQHVTTLVDEEVVELRLPAPSTKGSYSMQLCVRSDSYLDCDITRDIKFEVQEAREVKSHPQWDFQTDDEQGDKSDHEASDVSEEYTEDEGDDDE